MAELEKVIRGLGCLSNPYVQDMDERDCENCQYDNACCFLDVTADALSLLKAQDEVIQALLKVGYPTHGTGGLNREEITCCHFDNYCVRCVDRLHIR